MKVKNNKLKVFKKMKSLYMLLNNNRLKAEKIVIWRFAGGEKLTAKVEIKTIRRQRNEIIFKPFEDEIVNLKRILSGAEHVNIFLPNDGVLFQCNVKGYDEENIFLAELPLSYAQIDRRAFMRLNVQEHNGISVSIPNPNSIFPKILKKNLYDLSAGGFSFLCNKNEARVFYNEFKIKNVELSFAKNLFKVEIRVVEQLELEPKSDDSILYKCYKISFKFEKIDQLLKESINSYVFAHLDEKELVVN